MNEWIYRGQPVTELDTEKYAGFVYLITNNQNGKLYIGKKFLTTTRKLPPLKGKKRKRVVIKESNWKTYCSSNDELKNGNPDHYKREILHLCKTRAAVNQLEIIEQFKRDVLYVVDNHGERVYYNNNINGKFFYNEEVAKILNEG